MAITIIPAHEISLAQQADLFREAFVGYVGGPFSLEAASLTIFLRSQGIDLCYSRFARDADGLCGFGYITRTGDVSRISGMGVIPRARRMGIARKLLLELVAEARGRGDRAMVLEAIEQNPAAVSLYRSENFREIGRLLGWRRPSGPFSQEQNASAKPEIISPLVAGQQAPSLEFPELPWQISRHAIVRLANPRAYSSAHALVVFDDSGHEKPIRVSALLSPSHHQPDWSALRGLLTNVLQRFYSEREALASPIFPEIFGEKIFAPLGFAQEPLRQYLFRRDF